MMSHLREMSSLTERIHLSSVMDFGLSVRLGPHPTLSQRERASNLEIRSDEANPANRRP